MLSYFARKIVFPLYILRKRNFRFQLNLCCRFCFDNPTSNINSVSNQLPYVGFHHTSIHNISLFFMLIVIVLRRKQVQLQLKNACVPHLFRAYFVSAGQQNTNICLLYILFIIFIFFLFCFSFYKLAHLFCINDMFTFNKFSVSFQSDSQLFMDQFNICKRNRKKKLYAFQFGSL